MKLTTRSAVAGVALVLTGLLAACSGGSGVESAPPSDNNGSADETSQGDASGISNPKTVEGVEPCDLVAPDVLKSLGVNPQGEQKGNVLDSSVPQACVWTTPDGGGEVSVTPFPDRSIESYYQESQQYKDFAKMEIAGYPAVRATPSDDPKAKGSCALFAQVQEGQMLGSGTLLDNDPSDPCEKSKQALEAALEKLPAAK